jgi:glycosyltransferase involved in cell wall biosynthesis
VLLSQQVNIWREIVADGAGLAAPDTSDGTVSLLREWEAIPADRRAAMRLRAAECYARRFNIDAVARSFVDVVQPFLQPSRTGISI